MFKFVHEFCFLLLLMRRARGQAEKTLLELARSTKQRACAEKKTITAGEEKNDAKTMFLREESNKKTVKLIFVKSNFLRILIVEFIPKLSFHS